MGRRRGGRGILRYFVIAEVLVWLVPKLFPAVGVALAAVFAVPFLLLSSVLAAVVAVPFLLVSSVLAVVVIVAVLALVVAAAAGVIGVPAWLFWRASKEDRERRDQAGHDADAPDDAEREAARLRRLYVAGQLTDDQFRVGMIANLKARFAAGSLDVSEYEAEVARLLRSDVDSTPLRQLRQATQPHAKRW